MLDEVQTVSRWAEMVTRIIHEDTLEVMFGVFFGAKRSVATSYGVFGKLDLRIS